MKPYDPIGSTSAVDFDTTKDTFTTSADLCHLSHVVSDSGWEAELATKLEHHPRVRAYVKNQGLGFTIPYSIDGQQRGYVPDFIVRIDDGHGDDDLLNMIVEVSGATRRDKERKVATSRDLWIPAVNSGGGFGRWAFVEVSDIADAVGTIDAAVGDKVFSGGAVEESS
jgi:type III restriction enzyme